MVVWRWLGLAVVVLVTFILVRIAVLNVFYTTGDMRDPGWLASVTWHNGWRLHGPAAFPGPYFSEHLTPILWLTNAISFVVSLAKFGYYAVLIAAIHALYAAGVWRAWQLTEDRSTPTRVIVAILVALAAAFGGIPVVALGLPHPELAIPALALWFVIAMARRTYIAAACWLAACLSIREDAGLHVFALLTLWATVLAWRQRSLAGDIRWLASFAVVAFGYSAAAFLARRVFFPSGDILSRSYLGKPPFQHLTPQFISERLHYDLVDREYVLLTFIWAAISRNPLLPLGYIATLPWLALSIVAVHFTPGTLNYDYGFPFWLSLAWPLVALYLWRDRSGLRGRRWPYALVLLASLVSWQEYRFVAFPLERSFFGDSPFVYNDTLRERGRVQTFVDYFLDNRPLFGRTALDEAVFGHMIDHADRTSWLELWPRDQPPDTVIYFIHAYEWQFDVLPLLRSGDFRCVHAVAGTRIQVATQDPLSYRLPVPTPFTLIASAPETQCGLPVKLDGSREIRP
jgi:hypothetical protein